MLGGRFPARGGLSTSQTLDLAYFSLTNAHNTQDPDLISVLCDDAASLLSKVKIPKQASQNAGDHTLKKRVVNAYYKLERFQKGLRQNEKAQTSYKAAKKWRYVVNTPAVNQMNIQKGGAPPKMTLSRSSAVASVGLSDDTLKSIRDDSSVYDVAVRSRGWALGSNADGSNRVTSIEHPSSDDSGSTRDDLSAHDEAIHVHADNGALRFAGDSDVITNSRNPASHVSGSAKIEPAIVWSGYQRHRATKKTLDMIPQDIFTRNKRLSIIELKPPNPKEQLINTRQLAYCLAILQSSSLSDDVLDHSARNWLRTIGEYEQERLREMAMGVIRAFKEDELKDAKAVAEVVRLAPVIEKDDFRYLLGEFYSIIDQSLHLDVIQLEGLAQLIQGAGQGYLEPDDLVRILLLLSNRLKDIYNQSSINIYHLTLVLSHILDAMADIGVKGLGQEVIEEQLSSYLEDLKGSSKPYLVYQAAYSFQALQCILDDKAMWQGLRPTENERQRIQGLVGSAKSLDLNTFIEGLGHGQQGSEGVSQITQTVRTAYDNVTSLTEGGQGLLGSLEDGSSFRSKCPWYMALRVADLLIQDGLLVEFRRLVCEVPFRCDPAFQWGMCQRIGWIAASPKWDADTRLGAVLFLGEIYRDDEMWGQQASTKQWVLKILMQLAASSVASSKCECDLMGIQPLIRTHRGFHCELTVPIPLRPFHLL
ncbi:hypothetical protein BGX34_007368 [Mortierella sp. NVP85]|nr:hypothetical protein BGX34_007368 [Mortierella sp. NVP85]